MVHWQCKLNVKDLFHNEGLTVEQKAQQISERLLGKIEEWRGNGSLQDYECDDIRDLAIDLKDAKDAEEFDDIWEGIYEWADYGHRLWIATI